MHRVAVRPQVAREVRARRVAAGCVVLLAVVGWLVVKKFPRELLRAPSLDFRPKALLIDAVTFHIAPPASGLAGASAEPYLRETLGPTDGRSWGPREPYREATRLRRELPWLASVAPRRDWFDRTLAFDVELQAPWAKAFRKGRRVGLIGAVGAVFEAPAGLFEEPALEVELGTYDAPDCAALLRAAPSWEKALPSPLTRAVFGAEGWELSLADGTRLFWGGLDFTDQKLDRLAEVLKDAGRRFGPGVTADLRYFEDGRILVRPAAVKPPTRTR